MLRHLRFNRSSAPAASRPLLIGTLSAIFIAPAALAQDASTTTTTNTNTNSTTTPDFPGDITPGFELRLTAGIYLSRASGTITNGPDGTRSFTLENTLELDDLEAAPSAELLFRRDRIDILLSGFDFSTEGDATLARDVTFGDLTLSSGERVRGEFDLFTAAVDLRYAFLPKADADPDITFRIAPSIGLRYIDLDQSITSAAGIEETASPSATAIMPGLWVDLGFRDTILINAGVSFGPNLDGGSQLFVGGSFAWHPIANFGVSIGYRQLDFVLDEDDYEVDGRLAGLFLAGSIRF